MAPQRIRLSRAKGWRIPAHTVKVDRTTPWGNPFVAGTHGTQAKCVDLFTKLAAGYLCVSVDADCIRRQNRFLAHAAAHIGALRGQHLACWCREGTPCHATVLLAWANGQPLQVQPPVRP